MNLIEIAIDRARVVLATLALLLFAGGYAYVTISKESDPDINIPVLYISMHLEGIAPSDAERLLVRPMERELTAIEGVDEMRATAYQSGGNVILEFQAGFNKDKAVADVREAVDKAKAKLPLEADEPIVNEVNLSLQPVLVVTLSGPVPERTLLRLARILQDRIESIPSVLEAQIDGEREEVVEILVSPELVESYGLAGESLIGFFARSNRLVAAGSLDTGAGRFAVEVPGLFETPQDIMTMPLLVEGDSAVTVADIARLRPTFKDPESFARMNGQTAIGLQVVKRTGENILDTIAEVRRVVEEEQSLWPSGVEVTFTQDKSKEIRTMLADLQNGAIAAILLVMIVIVWALGPRAATLVGISIPGSLLAGILWLYISGLTVNVVVLFSLILSVGMLVDGAIILVEFADRQMSEGVPRKKAYAYAAQRMAWPIIASISTAIAAFLPLLFWPGIVGEFMRYMPLTLTSVLGASIFMALIFVPVLGAYFGKFTATHPPDEGMLPRTYKVFLNWALDRPFLILGACVVLLIGSQGAYFLFGHGVEFFPDIEPERATILVHARGNLSVWEQDALTKEVEDKVLKTTGIEAVYTRSGSQPSGFRGDVAQDVIGQILIQFKEWDERPPAQEILEDIRKATATIAGVQVETQKEQGGPPTGKAVQVEMAAQLPEHLPAMVETVRRAMAQLGGFRDIEDDRPLPGIEWEMIVDRAQAAKFGLDLSTIGAYIRMVTNGLIIGNYRPDNAEDEVDIVLRYDVADRTLDQLSRLKIPTPLGPVAISSFVQKHPRPATGLINRVDQKRVLTVKADLDPGLNTAAKVQELRTWLEKNKDQLNKDVSITFRGEDEDQSESQDFLIKAFISALFLISIIMISEFNSFSSTLIVLSAVIMSTIGVMIGLLITGESFGIIMSGVGIIALAGIIVHNNIVFIDTFDVLRHTSPPDTSIRDIIVTTGTQRLRPVLLTALTAVIGLLPMALQINIDFLAREITLGAPSTQWWVQLSTAIAFGLTFATILTLIVTPCALLAREQIMQKLH